MRHLLPLLLLSFLLAEGVVIQERDLNIINGNLYITSGSAYVSNNVYVGGQPVLTASTPFSTSPSSDVNVSGTYNTLNIQIKEDAVGPAELNESATYTIYDLIILSLKNCQLLTTDVNGNIQCGSAATLCPLCDDRFVNATGDIMTGPLIFNLPSTNNPSTPENETTDAIVINAAGDHAGIVTNKDTLVVWNKTANTYANISAGEIHCTKIIDQDDSVYYIDPSNSSIAGKFNGTLDIKKGWGDWLILRRTAGSGYWHVHNPSSQERIEVGYTDDSGLTHWGIFVIKNTGAIGIGTTDPQEKLHVAGNVKIPVGKRYLAGDLVMLHAQSSTEGGIYYNVYYDNGWKVIDSTKRGQIIQLGPDSIDFWFTQTPGGTDWTRRFFMDYTGKTYFEGYVGIGTTNPTAKLDVRGTLRVTDSSGNERFGAYQSGVVKIGFDLLMARTVNGDYNWKRALVPFPQKLVINYDGDFTGGVDVQGPGISASKFTDRDNSSFYVDPSGDSYFNRIYANYIRSGDLVFSNGFKLVEEGNTLVLINQKGEKILKIDENGNIWIKGRIYVETDID